MSPLRWLLPESMYWLKANGREKEAEKILLHAAKLANVDFTTPVFLSTEGKEETELIQKQTVSSKIRNKLKIFFKVPRSD